MHEALKMVRCYRNVLVGNTGGSAAKPLGSVSWLATFIWVLRYNDIIKVRKIAVTMTGRQERAWRLYCLLNEACIYIE